MKKIELIGEAKLKSSEAARLWAGRKTIAKLKDGAGNSIGEIIKIDAKCYWRPGHLYGVCGIEFLSALIEYMKSANTRPACLTG